MAFLEKTRTLFENPKVRIAALVTISLIQGLIYVFIIPPWQHYDEPTHFEYAWLIADENALPDRKAVDLNVRREIAGSMVENNFFNNLDFGPNLISETPTWIGITQLRDPPGYYLLLALPLKIFKNLEVEHQLYIGRLLSMVLFVGTIFIAMGLLSEFVVLNSSLLWLVPLLIALTSSYVDIMTALNNDVGATIVLSLYLLLGVKLLVNGFQFKIFLLFIALMFASVFTKNTVYVAIPLALLLIFLSVLKRYWVHTQKYFFIIFGAATIFGAFVLFSNQDAAFWYRGNIKSSQSSPTRGKAESAFGSHAVSIVLEGETDQWLFQPLPPETTTGLGGKHVTLGAWIWASETVTIQSPAIWQDQKTNTEPIEITSEPAFYSISTRINRNTESIQVILNPRPQNRPENITIYYDDFVLVESEFPPNTLPVFNDERRETGRWDGIGFENLLRNPGFERNWMIFRPQVYSMIEKALSNFPRYSLEGIQDFKTYGQFYRHTLINLFQSFWGRFGWNHVALPSIWYALLAVITLVGVSSGVWKLRRQWPTLTPEIQLSLVWLGAGVAVVWISAFLRTGLPMLNPHPFIPSARYAYPVMLPTMAFLVYGLVAPFRIGGQRSWWTAGLVIFFIILNTYSIFIIRQFFST